MTDTFDSFFAISSRGEQSFRYGQDDPKRAAACACICPHFAMDDEDECTADEEISCYNCRWRRWSAASFTCRNPRHIF